MHTLSLPYPDDLLITSGKSPQALEKELTFLLAVKLFELHRFSLGATNLSRDSYQKQRVMNNTLSSLSRERKFAHLSN